MLEISVSEDFRRLRLVILGDTHGRPHPATLDVIRRQVPDRILHTGDVGPLSILDDLEEIAPTAAVRGNVDARSSGLPDVMTLETRCGDAPWATVLMVHVGLAGVRLRREIRVLARERGARLVICGHSHIPFLGSDGELMVFNPGAAGPRRFSLPVTVGCVDIVERSFRMIHLDCETGRQWLP